MKKIPLTQGKYALVDDLDYVALSNFTWHYIVQGGYAGRRVNGKILTMQRQLLGGTAIIDHANLNGLDNRRVNLRFCDKALNMANRPKQRNNTSGYKGVYYSKLRGRWYSQIQVRGKVHNLGYFDDPKTASEAYATKAQELLGEFARV